MNEAYARGYVEECSRRMVKRGQSTNVPPPMVTNAAGNVFIDPSFVQKAVSNNAVRIRKYPEHHVLGNLAGIVPGAGIGASAGAIGGIVPGLLAEILSKGRLHGMGVSGGVAIGGSAGGVLGGVRGAQAGGNLERLLQRQGGAATTRRIL